MSNSKLKELLINNIIPRIENIIQKEKKHLDYLINKHAPIPFIETTQNYYNLYLQRLEEYKEYVKKL